MQRRSVLKTLVGIPTISVFAGCLGENGPGDTPTEPGTQTPTPTPSGTPSATIQMMSRDCGEGANQATVTFDPNRLVITGMIPGNDTCAVPTVQSVQVDDDLVTVRIETTREETTGTVACAQCITDVEYTLTVTGVSPGRVTVIHDSFEGETTVTEATRPT